MRGWSVRNNSYSNWPPYFDSVYEAIESSEKKVRKKQKISESPNCVCQWAYTYTISKSHDSVYFTNIELS